MKRYLAAALTLLIMLTALPFIRMGVNAADSKVIYLRDGGKGNGSTPDAPAGDLKAAFEAIGKNSDGVIVICGTYTPKLPFTEPAHAGTVTITQSYNGKNYRKAGTEKNCLKVNSTNHYLLSGPTVFKDINIAVPSSWYIRARFNSLVFTGEVDVYNADGTFPQLFVVGGDQGVSVFDMGLDAHLKLYAGRFQEVIGLAKNPGAAYTGTAYIDIGGSAEINKVFGCSRTNTSYKTGGALITCDGGRVNNFVSMNDSSGTVSGATKPCKILLTENFEANKYFNDNLGDNTRYKSNGVFYGFSGGSAFAKSKVLISTSVIDLSKAKLSVSFINNMIEKDSFTEILYSKEQNQSASEAEESLRQREEEVKKQREAAVSSFAEKEALRLQSINAAEESSRAAYSSSLAAVKAALTASVTESATLNTETKAASATTQVNTDADETSADSGDKISAYVFMAAGASAIAVIFVLLGKKKK